MNKSYPSFLEAFYKSSALLSSEEKIKKIRESDAAYFQKKNDTSVH